MDIKEYYYSLTAAGKSKFIKDVSDQCDISPYTVRKYISGLRRIQIVHWKNIYSISNRKISKSATFPELY